MNANHPGLQCVCDAPLMEPLPLTDAQRLTQGHCGLIQRKSTVKHTNTKRTDTHSVNGRMDRQTNRQNAAALKNYWLQAESSHFPVTGVANVYFGTWLFGPEEHSKKEGEDKTTLFCPTVYRSLRKM